MLPQRPALISAGNILHGVGWKFQAAKHSSWGQRLSQRVGKQEGEEPAPHRLACCIHPVLCMVGISSHSLHSLSLSSIATVGGGSPGWASPQSEEKAAAEEEKEQTDSCQLQSMAVLGVILGSSSRALFQVGEK